MPRLDICWLQRAAHAAYFAGKHSFRGLKCGLLPLVVVAVLCSALLIFSLLFGATNAGTGSSALSFTLCSLAICVFCCAWIEISLAKSRLHLSIAASDKIVAAPCSATGIFVPLERPPRAV